jgi:hypothetical protein
MSFVIPVSKDTLRLPQLIMQKNWIGTSRRLSQSPMECKLWLQTTFPPSATRSKESSTRPCKSKELALHLAIRAGAPARVIKKMILKYPKALQIRDGIQDRYPLHLACLHLPDMEVLKMMIEKYKPALFHKDATGRVPLHYAAFGNAGLDAIELLVREDPKGARVQESSGWLPLHVATKMSCSFDIMTKLVEVFPESLTSKTAKKSTPKNLARVLHGPKSDVEEILNALESAVQAVEEGIDLSFVTVAQTLWASNINACHEDKDSLRSFSSSSATFSPGALKTSEHGESIPKEAAVRCLPVESVRECVICMDATSTHVYVPCGHMCICKNCAELQAEQTRKCGSSKCCPVCRKQAFLIMKVFS